MTDESQQDRCATRRCVLLGAGVLGAAGHCPRAAPPLCRTTRTAPGRRPPRPDADDRADGAPAAGGGMGSGSMSSGSMSSPTSGSKSSGRMSSPSGSAPMGGTALGSAADIPVGGGKVYTSAQVVVTQPTAGQYKAFSAICTHVGCICNQVAGGTINCPCHGANSRSPTARSSPAPPPLRSPAPGHRDRSGKILPAVTGKLAEITPGRLGAHPPPRVGSRATGRCDLGRATSAGRPAVTAPVVPRPQDRGTRGSGVAGAARGAACVTPRPGSTRDWRTGKTAPPG